MKMLLSSRVSLLRLLTSGGLSSQRFIADANRSVAISDLDGGSSFDTDIEEFRGRSILICTESQLSAALALVQLDGIARRIILCPPDLAPADMPAMIALAEVDMIVTDSKAPACSAGPCLRQCGLEIAHKGVRPIADQKTEWLLFTSGTTGRPKLVIHTLDSLAGPIAGSIPVVNGAVWSTFYDIRRYGGLQILLRAFLGGSSIVFSDAQESVGDFLKRAGSFGVTHISGTPSHWRRALMSPLARKISPIYIRLSGEVADQAILNHLKHIYPAASIAHAFASTEAGVAFDINDGYAGFPASLIDQPDTKVEMRVTNGSLRIRSLRTAKAYAGEAERHLMDEDGFVETGDMIELRGDRYYFAGRLEGGINVGGLKVHPEEVEAVINVHPAVQMSRVQARRSPITGAIVVADIVVRPIFQADALPFHNLKYEILEECRRLLPVYKIPAMLREVPYLELSPAGKLMRLRA